MNVQHREAAPRLNARGLRVIIIIIQVREGKCSSSSAGAQEKRKIVNESNFCIKISAKFNFAPLNFICKKFSPYY
jgi:hypothetical protein